MNGVAKTFALSRALVVSQLRASRPGNGRFRVWERPSFIVAADSAAFALSWFATFEILSIVPASSSPFLETTTRQILGFLPIFVLAIVVLAGLIFELGSSSKFASSDAVNWLPITKVDYVAASALSVGFVYSIYLCSAAGITLGLAAETNMVLAWAISSALGTASLVTGGFFIEILRASVNRVYSIMSMRTGRGTLLFRLFLIVLVLVAVQVAVNPYVLFGLMTSFVGVLDTAFFVPPVWSSLTVFAIVDLDFPRAAVFGSLSLVFVACLFIFAVWIRTRYWSPSQAWAVLGSGRGYSPRASILSRLGLSDFEASVIWKDFKAYTRQKELLSMFVLPFILTAALGIQLLTLAWTASDVPWIVALFTTISGIVVSSSSIGIEGRSFANMYAIPLNAKALVRAKAWSSLIISGSGALAMSAVATVLVGHDVAFFVTILLVSGSASVEAVFVGLNFGTRYADFSVRPRARYISYSGLLMALVTGVGIVLLTCAAALLVFPGSVVALVGSALLALAFSALAFRFSAIGAEVLMREMKD